MAIGNPAPRGACDTHMHFYGDPAGYPVPPGTHLPPGADLARYRALQQRFGLERVVVVQPSAYGADNRCTMDHVAAFGDAARAVVVVTPDTPEAELEKLHAAGARGARFFMLAGAPQGWDALPRVAARIAPFGWHVQLQFDGAELPDRLPALRALPCPVVIDHLGRLPMPAAGTAPLDALLRLLEGGRAWVKASAPYHGTRAGPPDYADAAAVARAVLRAAPERVVWASNWPHPNHPEPKPDDAALLALLADWTRDEALRRRVLVENPAALYGFASPAAATPAAVSPA